MKRFRPKSLVVLGHPVSIQWDAQLDDLHGDYNSDKGVIRISKDTSEPGATLLHEVCHAILHRSGLSSVLEEKLEEAVVRAIEHGLFPLLPLLSKVS